ncbi:hypothetical protein J6497_27270 [Bradyrhizobium sp. CNPSo 4026]|nr:hypothetical protein [Bradyrhizobium cenepequi]
MIKQARRGRTLRLAFLSAVISQVVSFAAAAAPIRLFNIYRAEDGFTNAGIAMLQTAGQWAHAPRIARPNLRD